MITKLGTGTLVCIIAIITACTTMADDSVTIDISAHTTNATRMSVLEDHTLAVLDGVNKQIILLQSDGTYIKTIDIGDYTLKPIDIAPFAGRIGILDSTGLPNVGTGHVLLFNRSGAHAGNLPGSSRTNAGLGIVPSSPTEVIPFISGAYVLKSHYSEIIRTSDGDLYSIRFTSTAPITPNPSGINDSNEHWQFYHMSGGEYHLYRTFPGDIYITIPASGWGGDTVSMIGMASFGGNHFGLLNEQHTSLVYMNTTDGYIDRVDDLPTAGLTVLDVEGDLRSNEVYLLSASKIIKITVTGVDPLGFSALKSASQTNNIEFTWRKTGNYKLYIYDSIADTAPAQIINITDTMPSYSYSIGADDKRFFRLIAQ